MRNGKKKSVTLVNAIKDDFATTKIKLENYIRERNSYYKRKKYGYLNTK